MRALHYTILALTFAWAVGWIVFAEYYVGSAKTGEEQFAFWFYVTIGVVPLLVYAAVALMIWLSVRLATRPGKRTPRSRR